MKAEKKEGTAASGGALLNPPQRKADRAENKIRRYEDRDCNLYTGLLLCDKVNWGVKRTRWQEILSFGMCT